MPHFKTSDRYFSSNIPQEKIAGRKISIIGVHIYLNTCGLKLVSKPCYAGWRGAAESCLEFPLYVVFSKGEIIWGCRMNYSENPTRCHSAINYIPATMAPKTKVAGERFMP